MTNARDIILKPVVKEKSIRTQNDNNTVVFEVAKGANRTQVKKAIEEIFNVKVEKVNMVNIKPKTKRVGRYIGHTKAVHKAYVNLTDASSITIQSDK